MTNYWYPKFTGDLSDSNQVDEFAKTIQRATERNDSAYQRAMTEYGKLLSLAHSVFGIGSKQYKYLKGNPPDKPKSLTRTLKNVQNNHRLEMERKRKNALARASAARRKLRLQDAILFLTDAGYVLNVDFYQHNALDFLDSITETESGVIRIKGVQS